MSTVSEGFNTHLWGFWEDRWENIHFESKPKHVTPQIDCLGKNEHCSEDFNTHSWHFWGDRWENIHFESKPRHVTPQINHLGKMSTVLRVWIHIYGVSQEIDGKNMHSQPSVATQHKKTNKVVWTCKDDWPHKRTSTYKRPFTREGNHLVFSCNPVKNVHFIHYNPRKL